MKKFALYKSLLIIICLLGVTACGDGKKKEEVSIGKSNEKTQLITVDTLVLKNGPSKNRSYVTVSYVQ